MFAQEKTVTSAILKSEVAIFVQTPPGYSSKSLRYPVLYLLHATPETVAEIAALVDVLHRYAGTPEMVVVGIPSDELNIDRAPFDSEKSNADAEKMLAFLEKELLPDMDANYRTNDERTLMGEAASGSFTLYAFLANPLLFQNYIGTSSSFFDPNPAYFKELLKKAGAHPDNFNGRNIFLATLNGAYSNQLPADKDSSMTAFAKSIRSTLGSEVRLGHQAYDDWGLVRFPGFFDGLLWVNRP